MTPLQSRMHETVCVPSGLTACLCGAYARVGQAFADEQVERSDNHGMCVAAKDYDDVRRVLDHVWENLKALMALHVNAVNGLQPEVAAALSASAGEK